MEDVSRRAVLAGACGLLALGTSVLPAAANSAVRQLPDGKLEVRLKGVPALATIGGAVSIGTIKGTPVAVARTGTSKYTAFSLVCPHQGVTVTRSAQGWLCRAHGSQFESDGDLVLGPATKSLGKIPLRRARGVLVVG
jgi:Rieske Fe-S protein